MLQEAGREGGSGGRGAVEEQVELRQLKQAMLLHQLAEK